MLYVVLIIAIIEALGLLFFISNRRKLKPDGKIIIIETAEKKRFSLELPMDPDEIDARKYIIFEVASTPAIRS